MIRLTLPLAGLVVGILLSGSASATEQIYRPVSPTFGGNALSGIGGGGGQPIIIIGGQGQTTIPQSP